jgi:hypothetical protein
MFLSAISHINFMSTANESSSDVAEMLRLHFVTVDLVINGASMALLSVLASG